MKITSYLLLSFLIQKNDVYRKEIDVLNDYPEQVFFIYTYIILLIIGVVLLLILYFKTLKYLNLKIKYLKKKIESET